MKTTERLESLDALRGFDMFFIVGGSVLISALATLFPSDFSSFVSHQMSHVEWHGFAFYDMIFPLFLFIAGVSFPYSLDKSRENGKSNKEILKTILIRALKLIVLGLIINGFMQLNFEKTRYASVLGRIGIAWMLGAFVYMAGGRKWSAIITAILLIGYYFLAAFVPNPDAAPGTSLFSPEGSIVGWFDVQFLPGRVLDTLYDPEGILSTIPSVATALLGIITGSYLKSENFNQMQKVYGMLVAAVLLAGIGLFWNELFPINKKLWTSSYVCFAGGLSLLLLAIFYLVIDVLKWKRWAFFFKVIGLNSITIYVAQRVFNFHHMTNYLGGGIVRLFPEEAHPVVYAMVYLAVVWGFLYFLYRKKIFLKV
ncbi:MAG: DUF5009 domain-containing protein [Paludibacter sp.]|jgi:predicted acyltransferase|nr:DUF5009 domain-containing protein [Paludibacter sp.]